MVSDLLSFVICGVRFEREFGKVFGVMDLRSGLLRFNKSLGISLVLILFFGLCMRILFVSIFSLSVYVFFVMRIGGVVSDGLVLMFFGS